ncbi:MAG: hypothetical protein ABI778_10865 [Ignavibacteriota bacterium]
MEIWEIPIHKLLPMLKLMKAELAAHFDKGGRVKAVNPGGWPAQELLSDFRFIPWEEASGQVG